MDKKPELSEQEIVRNRAIDMYLEGIGVSSICRTIKRSRSWFYKVLRRYQQHGRVGLGDRSRAAQVVHNRISKELELRIVHIRKTIVGGQDPELKYANIGADSIAAELRRLNIEPPHRATINRILQRYDLVQPRQSKKDRPNLPEDYPWPSLTSPNAIHQVDFVSRYIRGSSRRIYGCHLLDPMRSWPYLRVISSKSAKNVTKFLVSAWQEIGLPTVMQIDNDIVWNGGGRGQRVLSTVVRLCLLVGVEVLFIPPYTPKANGAVEKFNHLWHENFWSRNEFRDIEHIQQELPLFETYCRFRRPLSQFEGKTANQITSEFDTRLLAPEFDDNLQYPLPITVGFLHFVRFVSHDATFSILNETWTLDKRWAGSTIRATIDTQTQTLCVYHHPAKADYCQLIARFEYPLALTPVPLDPLYLQPRPSIWPKVKNCTLSAATLTPM